MCDLCGGIGVADVQKQLLRFFFGGGVGGRGRRLEQLTA